MSKISEQQRVTRQINYLIIRQMWKYIHHCVENKTDEALDLYRTLGFTRNAYTCLITGTKLRTPKISDKKAKGLAKTGLPLEIFTGDKLIEYPNISFEEWKEYFNAKATVNSSKDQDGTSVAKLSTYKQTISHVNQKIKEGLETLPNNLSYTNLYKLFYFMTMHTAYAGNDLSIETTHALKLLQDLSLTQWKSLSQKELSASIDILEHSLHIAETLSNYYNL